MSDVPDDLKYTAEHEWVRVTDGSRTVRVGVTDYAQESLGDVVYVNLPDIGASVEKGAAVGEIESTKSVSDIYAPLSGSVTARNDALDDQPELINSSPYGDGWILEIEVSEDAELADLLDAAAYGTLAG
ncbi:glycine cleavage system H protein [Jatrophihabitans endophyticus]|uniref:Glycine cleavage system H protein n=1 Tax=Jatrophihabitans endophyticus TaxID=1206085 RepID=A0A1M5MRH9_9ACTN|nr:glycine cleavage system protein GcvH [Jatrophihabitans endophyticus]SHG79827.1 glycine cleavage system H protein [Jatrophihabitans endophyticus]